MYRKNIYLFNLKVNFIFHSLVLVAFVGRVVDGGGTFAQIDINSKVQDFAEKKQKEEGVVEVDEEKVVPLRVIRIFHVYDLLFHS